MVLWAASSSEGSWMPSWIKQRLPGALGGSAEYETAKDMSMDEFATNLKRARQMGGLTGTAPMVAAAQ